MPRTAKMVETPPYHKRRGHDVMSVKLRTGSASHEGEAP